MKKRGLWLLLFTTAASAQTYWVKSTTTAEALLQHAELQQAVHNGWVEVNLLTHFFKRATDLADTPTLKSWAELRFKSYEAAENLLPKLPIKTYWEEQPVPPPADIPPTTAVMQAMQGYLYDNPGHNFEAAWNLGLFGQGQHLHNVEYGFHKSHEEFVDNPLVQLAEGTQVNASAYFDYINHGTATHGVLVADPEEYGVTGAIHQAQLTLHTEWPTTGYNRVAAVAQAIDASNPGDVLLFEMQAYLGVATPINIYAPAEYNSAVWDLTAAATANGRVIIAAAGNGAQDLDSEFYAEYRSRGNSGAILVGAGSNSVLHQAEWYTNYGSRVDVQAWGNQVLSTGFGDYVRYNNDLNQAYGWFSGTSSASALTAAAAVLLQQAALNWLNRPLTADEMREILVSTGYPQGGNLAKPIGPAINVEAALQQLQQLQTAVVDLEQWKVFPNPSSDSVYWSTLALPGSWKFYDTVGKCLAQGDLQQGQLDVSPYPPGMYFLQVQAGEQYKIVKIIRR